MNEAASTKRGGLAALSPSRWPVRWRLAAVSAALTFAILVLFAAVVGRVVSSQLNSDFREEVGNTASELAFAVDVVSSGSALDVRPHLEELVMGEPGTARVIDGAGNVMQPPGSSPLGPPRPGTIEVGDLQVATVSIRTTALGAPELFLQYARDRDQLEATIQRLWLFLGIGVLGGTVLAAFAGIAVARRAMGPISALTAAAHEVGSTRDPSRRIPEPETDDEVAELARTLDEMLRQLDAARAETQQLMQAQREFVADASHELRTPLTSILANLELLQERLADDSDQEEERETVAAALRSSRRMSRLVSDLLLLARADAGRSGARHECDLAEVVAAAVSEVRPVANGHELALRADGPLIVEGNSDELHRLALNLLDNGLRHTPPGTGIEVSLGRRNRAAVLEVSDDGPGIPEGMEAQVFSRFVRCAGPADVAGDGGTGLGLAIVKAVAASHGGEVAAGASPSGGARFTITLPLH